MASDFITVGDEIFNQAHVTHVKFDGQGGVLISLSSGVGLAFTGEQADVVAKAFGRHDAKHATAKEAKAEEKAVAAEEKAAEPPAPAHHTSKSHK